MPLIAPIIIVAAVQESTLAPVVNYPCGIAHIHVSPRFCTHSTHPLPGAVVISVALAVGEAGAPVWIIWRRRRRWWRWRWRWWLDAAANVADGLPIVIVSRAHKIVPASIGIVGVEASTVFVTPSK